MPARAVSRARRRQKSEHRIPQRADHSARASAICSFGQIAQRYGDSLAAVSDRAGRPVAHPAPPAGRSSSDIPLWVLFVAVAVMLALAGVAAFTLTHDGTAKSSSYPDKWDSRIAPYAKIAEKQRGLLFMHPVTVRFLPAAEFKKSVTADEKELSKEDRTEIEQFTGLMRAFGLITGDLDLFEAVNDFSGGGTLAYYSFDDRRITIRGDKLTPAVRSTLVHELTHVLQDQHFAVGDRLERLRKKSKDGASRSDDDVLDAIIEGDAVRIQTLHRDSLTAKKRRALDAGRKDEGARASKSIKQVPKVIVTMLTSPYTLGESLVQTVAADGGNAAVNKLFRDAPTHESSLLDPLQVLAGDTDAVKVDVPKLEDGEKKFDSGEFGVLTWYLMLAERLPLLDALGAADGWGGDAYVAFERGRESCARMAYAGDTPADTTRMLSALRRWIAAAPGSPAEVSLEGGVVRFESCDPGKAADVGKDASRDAVGLVTTRTYLGVALIRAGAPENRARCLAGRLVREFPVSRLVDPKFGAGDPAERARVQQLAAGCR